MIPVGRAALAKAAFCLGACAESLTVHTPTEPAGKDSLMETARIQNVRKSLLEIMEILSQEPLTKSRS